MSISYTMLVYIPIFVITLSSALHSANRKEKKEERKVYIKDAIQFYAQGLDIWPHYIATLKTGVVDNVRLVLPLMATEDTYPPYHFNREYDELPIDDCSGLATVIETKSLSDAKKIELMDMIIDFYQPKKLECVPSCYFSCTSLCNLRRATLLIYGLAKAGELCLKFKESDVIRTYIYTTRGAYITNDALTILDSQKKTELKTAFTVQRNRQNREKQLLLYFNCFQKKSLGNYTASEYHRQIALPVMQGIKPDASWLWKRLCNKE